MVHWAWAVLVLFIGGILGSLTICLLAAGALEHSWRCGYDEGREDGFQAGLNKAKEIKNV
jgi:hypothetical protein